MFGECRNVTLECVESNFDSDDDATHILDVRGVDSREVERVAVVKYIWLKRLNLGRFQHNNLRLY